MIEGEALAQKISLNQPGRIAVCAGHEGEQATWSVAPAGGPAAPWTEVGDRVRAMAWSDGQLLALQKCWDGVDFLETAEKGLEGERCMARESVQ